MFHMTGTTATIRAAAEPSAAHPGSHRSGGEARSAGAQAGFSGASGDVLEPRDTIPCADAQGGPRCGPEPDQSRTQLGHDPRLCGIGSSQARRASGAGSRAVQR